MIKYKIAITQRAFSSINECVLFVKNVSKEAANDLYKEIIEKINSLSTLPNSYPEIDGLKIKDSKVRKMIIHNGRYAVIYKIDNDTVVIFEFLDIRKNNYILWL